MQLVWSFLCIVQLYLKRDMHREIVDEIESLPYGTCSYPTRLDRANLNLWIITKALSNDLLIQEHPEHIRHMQLLLIEAVVFARQFFERERPSLVSARHSL